MKTLLITGGSGYIGSHTVLELAKEHKYNLVVFDNFKNGNRKALEIIEQATRSKIEIIEGDLLKSDELNSAFEKFEIDAVIHFAALIEAGVSVVDPLRFYENNVSGTINLLKAMQNNSVKKIVFSSTAAVYGNFNESLATENSKAQPDSPYGESKLFVEQILRSLVTENADAKKRIDSVILRYFNAAGNNPELLIGQDYPKPTHLITVAIEAALGLREKLTIFGNDYPTEDGTCKRDYIHVQDLAKAHVKAIEYIENFIGSDIFNIGTGKATSNLEIVKILESIHGKFSWEFGHKRPGDPATIVANPQKAEKVLGWKAELSVEDAIRHSYEWKKKNPKGYETNY